MNAKPVIVAVFVVVAGVIAFFALRRVRDREPPGATPGSSTASPSAPDRGPAVSLTLLYSTEKKDWLEAEVNAFAKEHPEVKVDLVGKGSLDAAQDILDEKARPVLWSPADALALRLLDADYDTKFHKTIFAREGDDAPQPLVITPLVYVIWEDRADVLLKAGGAVSWKLIHKAVASNQGWPAIGGKDTWGFVKLGHTDPTRSNSGLQALLLMSLEYYGKSSGLEIADVLKPEYQQFVKETERGVSRFETSTGTFMTDMIRFGPSKYDIAVVYESLAIGQIENAQGRWGNLKVYYPSMTLWSDHPVVLLAGDWVTEPQRKAARTLIAFLRSRPAQEQALAWGFRPADPSVPIKTQDARNPFVRLAQYGISVDVPPAATLPEGPVVRNLMMMWSRVVANH